MKKTIIALIALAGVVSADGTLLWTGDLTGGSPTYQDADGNKMSFTSWYDGRRVSLTDAGVVTTGSGKYAIETHVGVTMADEFSVVLQGNIDLSQMYVNNAGVKSTSGNFLAFGEDGAYSLFFGVTDAGKLTIEGGNYTLSDTTISDSLIGSGSHTFIITLANIGNPDDAGRYQGALSVYVDGVLFGSSTMSNAGNRHSNTAVDQLAIGNKIQEWAGIGGTYTGVSLYEGVLSSDQITQLSIPEPTTATLSLLALAGLAAHRRRK